jgi:hypothetical protein
MARMKSAGVSSDEIFEAFGEPGMFRLKVAVGEHGNAFGSPHGDEGRAQIVSANATTGESE